MASSLRAWLLVCLVAGCGDGSRDGAHEKPRGQLGSAAALVNGDAIELAEVERLSAATGLAPKLALARLVGERLLAQYAEQRGYAARPAVRRGVARAEVQALLAQEIEAHGRAEDVEQRRKQLAEWLDALARQTPIRYDEAAIRKAFAR